MVAVPGGFLLSSKIITATSETDQARSTELLTEVQKDIWAKWPCMGAFIPKPCWPAAAAWRVRPR